MNGTRPKPSCAATARSRCASTAFSSAPARPNSPTAGSVSNPKAPASISRSSRSRCSIEKKSSAMSPYLILHTFLAGFFCFAAVHYFWLWCQSRREIVFLVFAVHCALCASIGPFLYALATATTVAACQSALDARTTIGLLIQISTVWIFAIVTEMRSRWFPILVSAVCLLMAAINVLVVPITGVVTGLDQIHSWWGEEITVPRHTGWHWWLQPLFVFVVAIYVFGLLGAVRLWNRDHVGGLLVGLAAGIGVIKLIEPVLVDVFHVRWPYSGSLPEPVFVILITVLLSREYRLRGERLAVNATILAANEARYRTLTESAPEAVIVLDYETGLYCDFNEKACRLFGYSPEVLRTMGPSQLSPPQQPDGRDSFAAAAEYFRQAVAGGQPDRKSVV